MWRFLSSSAIVEDERRQNRPSACRTLPVRSHRRWRRYIAPSLVSVETPASSGVGAAQQFEIGDQPGPNRFPLKLPLRLCAGGRHVVASKHCEPAEIGLGLFRGDGFDRQLQASTNGFAQYRASAHLLPRPRDTLRSAQPFRSPASKRRATSRMYAAGQRFRPSLT